ncbi:hypothetical protein BP6252_09580 [Coleophoma cylindrospora]|uniref:Peptidase A1 domain-containing protein n=1 Tax=Coleophoma cylindrospora TaxID=1849047 RepID=A0A3D8R2Z6_9HELO|nr:hypothetical protein BP6252_09580 [Coleophoma cylindrospora]
MKPRSLNIITATSLVGQSFAASNSIRNNTVPTVYMPLNYYYGSNHKISTNIVLPWNNQTIEAVYDQGSENFFMFGPNSIDNWGCNSLLCQGHCNQTVPAVDSYDYLGSPTASAPVPFEFAYNYGGFDKHYAGQISVNDTFGFSNVAGQSSVIPDMRVGIADYLQQRLGDSGTCIATPLFPEYDFSILGISPVQYGPTWNTTGPSVRTDLLYHGVIDAPVQCMWFDQAPENVTGTYTGGGIFGGIDTSKFTGPLVKVPTFSGSAMVGYFISLPTTSVNGIVIEPTSYAATTMCQLDSGTMTDTLPISDAGWAVLQNITGITRSSAGLAAWPGTCQSIPANITIDLEWTGKNASESVIVKVPIRAYARYNTVADEAAGLCTLNLLWGSTCMLAAPFTTAAFFAADDENIEIALAQGGASVPGSGPDEGSIMLRIP